MRLRIFDFRCPWFWVVIFYQNRYSEPRFELSVYREHTRHWWFYLWQREKVPNKQEQFISTGEL